MGRPTKLDRELKELETRARVLVDQRGISTRQAKFEVLDEILTDETNDDYYRIMRAHGYTPKLIEQCSEDMA